MSKCRACLKSKRNMIPFNENYIMYFNILTNLNLQLSYNNPKQLCKQCFKILEQFIEFREKCIAANTEFTDISTEVQSMDTGTHIPQDVKQKDERDDIRLEVKIEDKSEQVDEIDNITVKIKKEDKSDDDYPRFEDNTSDYSSEAVNEFNYGINLKVESDYNTEGGKTDKSEIKDIKTGKENKKKCNKTSAKRSLPCGLCTSSFEDKTQLHCHLQTHKSCSKCPVCGEKFADWQEAIAHRLSHLLKQQQQCHLCQLEFKTVYSMEFHFRTAHHTDGERRTVRCRECDAHFRTRRGLQSHHVEKHTSLAKHFYCDVCKKLFFSKSTLRKHIVIHAVKSSERTLKCDQCDYVCRTNSTLKVHKVYKHNPARVFCSTCKRSYVSEDKKATHKCKVRTELCPVCGKTVIDRGLDRHMHSHELESRFLCNLCPARFKTSQSLRVHRDRHAGTPRWACTFCPAKFYFPSVLTKHRRIHTGEKPYVCNVCQKAFTGGHNLKLHMRVHGVYLINKKNENEDAQKV